MLQSLIALAVFGGVVWMIAYAIFLLLKRDSSAPQPGESRDTFSRFVEENYGSRFMPEQNLHRCGAR